MQHTCPHPHTHSPWYCTRVGLKRQHLCCLPPGAEAARRGAVGTAGPRPREPLYQGTRAKGCDM
eukprot:1158074-Pelagomonas_calceolata.AAC.11